MFIVKSSKRKNKRFFLFFPGVGRRGSKAECQEERKRMRGQSTHREKPAGGEERDGMI
jgi:hypothetical protein